MATKAKKAAAPSKKSPEPKRGGKAAAKAEKVTAAPAGQPAEGASVDADELEEQQDAAAAAASGGAGGGNAAALAAAAGTTEMSASFKNFRHHPDMENFYRFIYENDLRHEALAIIDEIQRQKLARKALKGAKAQAH